MDETTFIIGPTNTNIKKTSDASKFTGGSAAVYEQSRNKLGDAPILRAVYEEEPAIAIRTIGVSHAGSALTTPQGQLDVYEPDATFIYGSALEVVKIREYIPSTKRYSGNIIISTDGYIVLDRYDPWMDVGCSFLYLKQLLSGALDPNEEYEITSKNNPGTPKDTTTRSMTFDQVLNRINFTSSPPAWMKPGRWIKVIGGLNTGVFLTITNVTSTYIEVVGTIVNDTGTFTLDGRLFLLELNPSPSANYAGFAILDGSIGDKVKVTNLTYGSAYEVTQIYITSDTVQSTDIIRDIR
jgi:hypothetical protein